MIWRYQTGGKVKSSPAVSANGTVYIGSDDGVIYALRSSDGSLVWSRTTGGAVTSSPAISANGIIYAGSWDGRIYAIGEGTVDVDEVTQQLPSNFKLEQNYPNPFNPVTIISFSIPIQSHCVLKIFNMLGQEIAALLDELKSPGTYTVEWNSLNMPSGVYFYRLEAVSVADPSKTFVQVKKMLLIR